MAKGASGASGSGSGTTTGVSSSSSSSSQRTAFPCLYVPGDAEKGNVILRHNPSMKKIVVLITVSWSLALVDLFFHFVLSAKMGLFKKVRHKNNNDNNNSGGGGRGGGGGGGGNHTSMMDKSHGSHVRGSTSNHHSHRSSHSTKKNKLAKPSSGRI